MGMLAKIRRMHFRDKVSLREIARQTGLSRNTIRHWLRQEGMMAQVLAAVAAQGLEPVVVAVELALESGNISGDHVLNVLARLQAPTVPVDVIATPLLLTEEPQANVQRYDHLRVNHQDEVCHVH